MNIFRTISSMADELKSDSGFGHIDQFIKSVFSKDELYIYSFKFWQLKTMRRLLTLTKNWDRNDSTPLPLFHIYINDTGIRRIVFNGSTPAIKAKKSSSNRNGFTCRRQISSKTYHWTQTRDNVCYTYINQNGCLCLMWATGEAASGTVDSERLFVCELKLNMDNVWK